MHAPAFERKDRGEERRVRKEEREREGEIERERAEGVKEERRIASEKGKEGSGSRASERAPLASVFSVSASRDDYTVTRALKVSRPVTKQPISAIHETSLTSPGR